MPFILVNHNTSEVLTGNLVNTYDLVYYGTVHWNTEEDAKNAFAQTLKNAGVQQNDEWELIEISESVLKMCNVKLNNDPRSRLYLQDGKPLVRR